MFRLKWSVMFNSTSFWGWYISLIHKNVQNFDALPPANTQMHQFKDPYVYLPIVIKPILVVLEYVLVWVWVFFWWVLDTNFFPEHIWISNTCQFVVEFLSVPRHDCFCLLIKTIFSLYNLVFWKHLYNCNTWIYIFFGFSINHK